jgi:hypothetical protein
MNNIPVASGDFKVPRELAPFIGKCPRLLPGESEQDYSALFRLMMDEIEPESVAEWMVGADIVALFWDIERYRAWKGAILNTYRVSSLEAAFRTTNRSEPVDGDVADLFHIARKQAEEWRTDPVKREVLKSRLLEHGYDEETLNAGALLEGIEPLSKIERFLSSARGQLTSMLKEVYVRREFAERAQKALRERLQAAKKTTVAPKQITRN